MTVEQAGQFYGLGRSAAYAAAARGDIPTVQLGRRVVVPTAVAARQLGLTADDLRQG